MNQLVPYNQQVLPVTSQPTAVVQPTAMVQPAAVIPAYLGANTAADYYYTQPMYPGYPSTLDYGMPPSGYRGFRRYYPRKRGRFARAMEALVMGSESERLRAVEVQADMMGYAPPYGYPRSTGFMDDGYYGRGMYYGRCPYPHRRGMYCPECDPEYYY
jgi:hypothetical protein